LQSSYVHGHVAFPWMKEWGLTCTSYGWCASGFFYFIFYFLFFWWDSYNLQYNWNPHH